MFEKVRPTVDSVRELSEEDLACLIRAPSVIPPMKKLRDSHHRVARLMAMGLRPGQLATATGYSHGRISTLAQDPAFQELVAHYRSLVDDSFKEVADDYYDTLSANRIIAARLLNDKLCDADPDDIGFRELVLIHADAADRTGYPKRTVALNVNADFASLLDRAIERSKEAGTQKSIEHQPQSSAGGGDQEHSLPADPGPQSIRRLA